MSDIIRTKARRWGSSIGFVLPATTRKNLRIKPGQDVEISIRVAQNPLKDLWGALPRTDIPTRELLEQTRKETIESKW
jgi:antitoxin component of MazEF toxin-antitoxin module